MSDNVQVYVESVARVLGRGLVLVTKVNAELPWPLVGKTFTFLDVRYRISAVEWMRPFNLDRPRVGDRIGLVVRPVVVNRESVVMKITDFGQVAGLVQRRTELLDKISRVEAFGVANFEVRIGNTTQSNDALVDAARNAVVEVLRTWLADIENQLRDLGVEVSS